MTYSRVKKYQELRDGLKDEVAISKENRQEKPQVEEEDDFLSFMKKDKNIGWLAAIEEAKKIIFKDKEVKTDIDNGIVYDIETGENIIEL